MRITINLILMLAFVSTPAVAENLFVPSQFGTIQAAVDAASPRDRILVSAGAYVGALINKPVTILGVGDATIIFHGPNRPVGRMFFQNGFRLTAGADGTKIGHLKIELSAGAVSVPMGLTLIQNAIFSGGVSGGTVDNITCVLTNRCIDVRFGNKWKITNTTVEGLNSTEFSDGTFRQAQAISLRNSEGSLIAFNTITHDSQGNAGERYVGIDLTFILSDTVPLENNKLIQNEIAVDAPGADLAADIRLFDRSALNGGAVMIFDNKIIGNDADPPDLEPPLLADHNVIQ